MADAIDDRPNGRTLKSVPGSPSDYLKSKPLMGCAPPIRPLERKAKRVNPRQARRVKIRCPECPQKVRKDRAALHLAKHKSQLVLCPEHDCSKVMCRRDLEHHLLEHGPKPRPMPGLPKRASGSPRAAESARETPPTWRSRYYDPNPPGMTRTRLPQWSNPPPKPAVALRISPPPITLPAAPPNQAADSRCEICNRIMSARRIPEHLKLECPGRPGSAVRLPFGLLPPGPWCNGSQFSRA